MEGKVVISISDYEKLKEGINSENSSLKQLNEILKEENEKLKSGMGKVTTWVNFTEIRTEYLIQQEIIDELKKEHDEIKKDSIDNFFIIGFKFRKRNK